MEEVCRKLKTISTALNDLSLLLGGLELGQGGIPSLLKDASEKENAQRTTGYVNWNSTHDILKTEEWVDVSIITDYCRRIENGDKTHFKNDYKNDYHVVNETTRFPKHNLYVNVQSVIVRAELLNITHAGKFATLLVKYFMNIIKDEMHTLSSFEKKYGLKWVEPISKESIVANTEPIQEAMLVPSPVNENIVKAVIPDSWCLSEDPESEEEGLISKEDHSEEDPSTRQLRAKFKDILDKLIPRKFHDLLEKVMKLEINNQKQMEVVVDLLFEKALEVPIYSEVYAKLAHKLSKLKLPSDNNSEKYVTFRMLLIDKCQNLWKEKELVEISEPTRKRAVANVRFIGELYKMKMITWNIIDYCLRNLSQELDEHKFECLCELLTTTSETCQEEMREHCLELILKKMLAYADLNRNKISNSVECMFQDIIDLSNKGWVNTPVVKALPKTMDEIQEESEKRALLIELMKAFDVGASTSDGGGGVIQRKEDGRAKHAVTNMAFDVGASTSDGGGGVIQRKEDGRAKHSVTNLYSIDALKLEAVKQETQNYILLPPKSFTTVSDDILEKLQAFPSSRDNTLTNRDVLPTYKLNDATVESTTINLIQKNSPIAPKVPLNESQIRSLVKNSVCEFLVCGLNEEVVAKVKLLPSQYHPAVVDEILNVVVEKTMKEVETVASLLQELVATKTISPSSFVAGLVNTFTYAPDVLIDVPMLYDYLGKILAPQIKNNHVSIKNIFDLSETIIFTNQGDRLLTSIIDCLCEDMGNEFVRNKWQESGMNVKKLSLWMREEQVSEWIYDNDYEFLHFDSNL